MGMSSNGILQHNYSMNKVNLSISSGNCQYLFYNQNRRHFTVKLVKTLVPFPPLPPLHAPPPTTHTHYAQFRTE